MNQILQKSLVQYVEVNPEIWDLYIDGCLFSDRTAVHGSTRHSPFEVMCG